MPSKRREIRPIREWKHREGLSPICGSHLSAPNSSLSLFLRWRLFYLRRRKGRGKKPGEKLARRRRRRFQKLFWSRGRFSSPEAFLCHFQSTLLLLRARQKDSSENSVSWPARASLTKGGTKRKRVKRAIGWLAGKFPSSFSPRRSA